MGKIEGKGKGKNLGQNMGEMGQGQKRGQNHKLLECLRVQVELVTFAANWKLNVFIPFSDLPGLECSGNKNKNIYQFDQ